MKSKLKAFAHNVNLFSCFVGKTSRNIDEYVGIQISLRVGDGIEEYVFITTFDDGIGEDEVIIPEACFGIWKIFEGDFVDVVFVERESVTWNGQYPLVCAFIGYIKDHHWDELEYNHMYQDPTSMILEWPSKLSIISLQSMGRVLLSNYLLFHGGKFIVRVLDINMVFQAEIPDLSANIGIYGRFCENIQFLQYQAKPPLAPSSSWIPDPSMELGFRLDLQFHYQYLDHVHSKILSITEAMNQQLFPPSHFTHSSQTIIPCNKNTDYSLPLMSLPSSLLIAAPKGAGKSIYSQNLIKYLQNNFGAHPNCLLMTTQCKSFSKLQYSSYQQTNALLESQYPSLTDFEVHLFLLLHLLFDYSVNALQTIYDRHHLHHIAPSEKSIIFLCLDDLDCMFRVFANGLDQENGDIILDNEYTRMMKLIAYHLNSLQIAYDSMISSANEVHDSTQGVQYILLLIGTTTYSKNDLPRKQLGCPEFEVYLTFLKPNDHDLFMIWKEVLQKKCSWLRLESIDQLEYTEIVAEEDAIDPKEDDDQVIQLERWSKRLAKLTKGYYFGDIMDVIQQALLYHQGQRSLHSTAVSTATSVLAGQLFQWQTILDALSSVPLKALSQLDFLSSSSSSSTKTEKQEYSWTHFYGYEELKQQLRQRLLPYFSSLSAATSSSDVAVYAKNALFQQAINLLPKGMVIYGPSGCGKTYLAKVLAHELHMNIIVIQSTQILSKYFGQTEAQIRKIFALARQVTPCLLFFDDFDALAHKRSNDDDGGSSSGNIQNRILSTFLNELDGVTSSSSSSSSSISNKKDGGSDGTAVATSSLFVLVACQSLNHLDEALIRPGRLSYHIPLTYPSTQDIQAIFLHTLASMQLLPPLSGTDTANIHKKEATGKGEDSAVDIESIVELLCTYEYQLEMNVMKLPTKPMQQKQRQQRLKKESMNNTGYEYSSSSSKVITAALIKSLCDRIRLEILRELIAMVEFTPESNASIMFSEKLPCEYLRQRHILKALAAVGITIPSNALDAVNEEPSKPVTSFASNTFEFSTEPVFNMGI